MATTIPANPTSHTVAQLLPKLNDADPDFRFMCLADLLQVLDKAKHDFLHNDFNTAARTVDYVIKAIDDQNGEVQNMAVKCLGPLVQKLQAGVLAPMVDKLSNLKLQNSVDSSIPLLALRTVVASLPRPVAGLPPSKEAAETHAAISRVLIPCLLGRSLVVAKGLANVRLPDSEGLLHNHVELKGEAVDVLIEVVRCFGPLLQPVEIEALQESVVAILEDRQTSSTVKKRAVVALSILAVYFPQDLLRHFVERAVKLLENPGISPVSRRLYISLLGSLSRSVSQRFSQHLSSVVPQVLKALDEEELQIHMEQVNDGANPDSEFDEVREAALLALEAFLASCPNQMRPYTEPSIASALRYIKYDPNYNMDEDGDDDMDEEDNLDEDDEEYDFDTNDFDDDDSSWKARKCAVKALSTLISTRGGGDLLDSGILYSQVAPVLVKRFDEREESVRIEVVSTLSLLVRRTGEDVIPEFSFEQGDEAALQAPQSRKRRRQSSTSGASLAAASGKGLASPVYEKVPASGPRADLAKLTPAVVKAATKILKGKLIPSKQAAINLLDDIVSVQHGGLAEYFDQLVGPIVDAIKPASGSATSATMSSSVGGNASATPGTLRVAALHLAGDVTKTHSSSSLQPYLDRIISAVVSAVNDRFYKISSEALRSVEEIVKAVTPPRSPQSGQRFEAELGNLFGIITERTNASGVDSEVREQAIRALGTLLSRTAGAEGSALLPTEKRQAGLDMLLDRLRHETTRLPAARAIDQIAAAAASSSIQLEPAWVRDIAVELSTHLRKANRALRVSSIQALKHLTRAPTARDSLDDATIGTLVLELQPIVTSDDPQLLGPALVILAHLAQMKPKLAASNEIIVALCQLLQSPVASSVLDSLLLLVSNLGGSGEGGPLMGGLLKDVGVNGDPSVVGQVIGTLLVSGGDSVGVSLDSFVQEVQTSAEDEARSSLALAVLGEAGLRTGAKASLSPDLFLSRFSEDYDKVSMSAAVALGRAGAGNVDVYLPVILKAILEPGSKQYLLLQSIKEILHQVVTKGVNISGFSQPIWDQLLAATSTEDNKAVCAECIGRMAVINPDSYIPRLEGLLKDKSPVLRGIAVQALRYTLADSGESFEPYLNNDLVPMIMIMIQDPDLEIRRLGLLTLNSALTNKPDLILGHLGRITPHIMEESKQKPELVREVQMGPFKHMVDDGLEVRKGAYETLYALMEAALARMSLIDLYDRIEDGLKDEPDIRALCNLMVSKLVYIDPEETVRRLDTLAERFRATLSIKLKDHAVKQDVEKQDETNRSVLRVTLLLDRQLKNTLNAAGGANTVAGAAAGANQIWASYWDWVNKDFDLQLRKLRDENKSNKMST